MEKYLGRTSLKGFLVYVSLLSLSVLFGEHIYSEIKMTKEFQKYNQVRTLNR